MIRTAIRGLISVGLLALTLATAASARAAVEVVVSASPADVRVGQPVEILVRTFVPIQREGTLAVPDPREPFPGSSGLWNVLYPLADDYPFDVVAQHENETEVSVTLARDPSDSTLWRGVMSLPKAGTWTIWVRNSPNKAPGSTTSVKVGEGPPFSNAPTSGSTAATNLIDASPAALVGLLLGLVGGLAVSRHRGRSRST